MCKESISHPNNPFFYFPISVLCVHTTIGARSNCMCHPSRPASHVIFLKVTLLAFTLFLDKSLAKREKEMWGSRDRESNKSAKLDAASASSGQNEITVLPNLPLSFVLLTTPLRIDVVVLLPFLAFHTITHLAVLQLLAHSKNFGGYGCRGCKCNAILCTVVWYSILGLKVIRFIDLKSLKWWRYRRGHPNLDSQRTVRVQVRVPMSVQHDNTEW